MTNRSTDQSHAHKPENGHNHFDDDSFTFSAVPGSQSAFSQELVDRRPLPNIDAQSSPVPIAAQLQTAAQRREYAKARRRVPVSQRKRTKLSCDACKAKRCKCLRTVLTPEPDDVHDDSTLAPCKTCQDLGIPCVTTLPRKQRVYGSVEQLDRRYRALDALVSGLLPDLPHDATPDELLEYGRQRGIQMPDLGLESEVSRSPATSISALVSSVSPPTVGQRIGDEEPNPDDSNSHFLKDTNGQSYYIGPSGSLASFARIRDLIARRLRASGDPDAGRRVQHLSSKSVTDTIARSFDRSYSNVENMHPYNDSEQNGTSLYNTEDSQFWVATSKIKLPSKEVADACMNEFFDYIHPDFLTLHRPTFQEHYEDIWRLSSHRQSIPARAGQKENLVSVGWLCGLYMIFILGSRVPPQDPKSLQFQRTWYEAAKELSTHLITSTLPNVCALMLLALYSQSTNDHTKSWVYLGQACRLAIALGMHKESTDDGMEPVVKETRKLVWWTLYDFEQHLCCSLGRPSAIDDSEVNIGVPNAKLLQCVPDISPEYMDRWVHLIRLQSTVRREVHTSTSASINNIPRTMQLLQQLGSWKQGLPEDLARQSPSQAPQGDPGRWRRITLLHLQHQNIISLLTNRYLLNKLESVDRGQGLGQYSFAIMKLSKICVTSAMRCIDLLVDLWRANQFNGATWLDTYYACLSSTQICLSLLEQSQTYVTNAYGDQFQGGDWRFQPHESPAATEVSQPCTELDFKLQCIIAQSSLIETYSAAQLTDAVRQIHDLLKTVPMSGFSAKCEAIAMEFGKAIGACDGKPSSTLFGGYPCQMMDKVGKYMSASTNDSLDVGITETALFDKVGAPGSMLNGKLQGLQMPLGQSTLAAPIPSTMANSNQNVLDYLYSGVLDVNGMDAMLAFYQPQVQWDIVQQLEEWTEHNGQFTDIAANSMFWPLQGEFPYANMKPPQ